MTKQSIPDIGVNDTFPKLLRYNAQNHGQDVAVREKDFGIWKELTWAEYRDKIKYISLGLHELGLQRGDVLGLIGDNNIDLTSFELAGHVNGAMTMAIYRDVLDEEISYLAMYAEAKMVFAEDQEQVDKFLALGDKIPSVQHIIYSDPRGMKKFEDPRLIDLEELVAKGHDVENRNAGKFDELVDATNGDDVAILCTTSGTTSNPKLAMLTHGRFIRHTVDYLTAEPKDSTDEYVSVLPLPWIVEQVYIFGFGLIARMKVNFPESEATAMHDMREIGPTFVLLAPRVLEQIAADMRARVMDAGPLTQWIFEKGLEAGVSALEKGGRSWLADKALFGALRDRLGFSRVRRAATGGAAMGPDTFKLFLAMGVPLRQLYGQTELIGAYTLQVSDDIDTETVGVPFRGCEVKIENPDSSGMGEIVTRHENMFTGYYKNEEATNAELRDGWMYTGDAGYFDDKQRLVVIDRMKDIAEMTGGLKFSPQYIENKLKFSPYIGEAVVLGAGKEHLSAIICVRFSIVSKWAEKNRIPFTSYTNLSDQDEVYGLIEDQVEQVNLSLPDSQKIKKFLLLYKELDADDGELTRTRKVRRTVVEDRYIDLVNALYSGGNVAHIDTEVTFEDGRKGKIQADMKVCTVRGTSQPELKKAS